MTDVKDIINTAKGQQHPFHVLYLSKLPIFMAAFVGSLALAVIVKLQSISDTMKFSTVINSIIEPFFLVDDNSIIKFFNTDIDMCILQILILILIAIWAWGYELVREATFEGRHTNEVISGLCIGMMLFLASEAMLFFPFFWAFFHASLSPAITIGGIWPPEGIRLEETLDPFMLPLANTILLLTSGIALVAADRAILAGHYFITINGLYISITLGILFSWLQYLEYGLTKYTITDGIFGSTFFMLTGLHGFHVIVGTCLLLITYWRTVRNHFSKQHNTLFELAAWYWHFVDVVWLFVFAFIYCWGIELVLPSLSF